MDEDYFCCGLIWFKKKCLVWDVKFLLKLIVKRIFKEYLFCYEVEEIEKVVVKLKIS